MTLKAAMGKVVITPEEQTGLGGFNPAIYIAKPPGDILDDVFARILILDDCQQRYVLVSVDCVMTNETPGYFRSSSGIPGQFGRYNGTFLQGTRQNWAQTAGVDERHVLVCATHAHSAPAQYKEKYVARITKAIQDIADQLAPVQLRIGTGSSKISAYRRPTLYPNPEVPIDQTLFVVWLETEDGKPFGSLVNYAVHPTILHPSDVQTPNRVSTECVGMAMNEVEADMGGTFISLFTQGFSGDVAPILPGIGATEDSYGNVKKAGHQLYEDITRAVATAQPIAFDRIRFAQRNVSLPTCDGFPTPSLDVTMTAISFGDLAILFTPGEIFNGYRAKIASTSPFEYTILTSLTNDYLGYFPTEEAFRDEQGGYEMRVTPFDERVDRVFTATANSLLADLFSQRG